MNYGRFTIVLPTLNEEGTISMLINRLVRLYKGVNILVMDDGSRDRTKSMVSAISRRNGRVRFFDRKAEGRERGLTASVVDGILNSKSDFVIVMDADMQHPPEIIKRMAAQLEKGSQLVVAVRSDVKGWELHRKLISKSMITFGYVILALTSRERSNDIFSGFFGVERRLFVEVYSKNRKRFVGGGYKVLFDFLKCLRHRSISIAEVPYRFGLREHGASKAGFKQGVYLFKSFFS